MNNKHWQKPISRHKLFAFFRCYCRLRTIIFRMLLSNFLNQGIRPYSICSYSIEFNGNSSINIISKFLRWKASSIYIFDCNRRVYIDFRSESLLKSLLLIRVSILTLIYIGFRSLISYFKWFLCVLWPCNIKHIWNWNVHLNVEHSVAFQSIYLSDFSILIWAVCYSLHAQHSTNLFWVQCADKLGFDTNLAEEKWIFAWTIWIKRT